MSEQNKYLKNNCLPLLGPTEQTLWEKTNKKGEDK